MSSLGVAFVTIRPDTSKFRAETESGIASTLKRVALLAGGIGVGVGLVRGFKDAITAAGDFQRQLNVLQAVSGATDSQLGSLREQAIALGKDIQLPNTSAQDAAEALTELVKAGLSLKDAQAGVKATLQLSAAAQIDNASAAEIAANALNQFALRGRDAGKVADLLAGAANASSGDIGDFAEALKFAGTASHAAGQSIGDTVTALAEMANKGLQGSIAGSSLAQVFRNLTAPTAKARAELDKLNISIFDQQGAIRPLRDIIDQFSAATENATEKQKAQELQTIFGSRSIQAARIVLLGGVDAFDKLSGSVEKTGNAQRLSAAQTKGFSGAINAFKSNIETLAIVLGSKLLPVITDVLTGLSNIAGASSFTAAIKITFTDVKAAIGHIVKSLQEALLGRDVIIQPKLDEAGVSQRVPGFVDDLRKAISDGIKNTDFGDVGRRIGESISKAITFTGDAVQSLVTGLISAVRANTGALAEVGVLIIAQMFVDILSPSFWVEHWRVALDVALAALTLVFLPAKFLEVLRAIPFARFIIDPLLKLGELLAPIVKGFGAAILKGLEDALPTVTGGVGRLIEALIGPFRAIPGFIVTVFEDFARSIGQALGFILRDIVSIGASVVRALVGPYIRAGAEIIKGLTELARSAAISAAIIVNRVINAFGRLIGPIARVVGRVVGDVLSILAGAAGDIAGAAARIGTSIFRGVTSAIINLPGRITRLFVSVGIRLFQAGLELATTAAGIGKAIIDAIINAIKSGASGIKDAIVGAVKGALNSAKDFLHIGSPSKLFHDEVGLPIMQGIVAGLAGLEASLTQSITGGIGGAIQGITATAPSITAQTAAGVVRPSTTAPVAAAATATTAETNDLLSQILVLLTNRADEPPVNVEKVVLADRPDPIKQLAALVPTR